MAGFNGSRDRGARGWVQPGDQLWAKPPLLPSRRLNLPRLTQPLPGMGGGGWSARGRGKSGQGWGGGQERESPSQGDRLGQKFPPERSPSPSPTATGKKSRSPREGQVGLGQRERENPELHKGKSSFIGRLLCARHCTRRLIYITALNPHNNPAR